ncbi:MAG: cytochrome c peroxidase [Pyrinomonadaceae bacterium]
MRQIKLVVVFVFFLIGTFIYFSQSSGAATATRNHRAGSLAAPTGVSASDGDYGNKIGVNWDVIRGAGIYRVLRNTTNDSATAIDVGTTAANYFFDTSAVSGQTYFYWVRAERKSELGPLSEPDQGAVGVAAVTPGPFPRLDPPDAPLDNQLSGAKIYLGKALFWDEQLSSTKTVACGTCHRPAEGGSDPRTVVGAPRSTNPGFDQIFGTADDVYGSPGVPENYSDGNYGDNSVFGLREQVTGRKSPSYLNAGYASQGLFWDGRASDEFRDQLTGQILLPLGASLESQSAGPPVSSAEMAHGGRDWSQVAARIESARPLALAANIPTALKRWIGGRTYPELFIEAFGTPDVTPARISMAIASHERTLFSDRTPMDRWAAGIERLTPAEERGSNIFVVAACHICHSGGLFSDNQFHNIGVRPQHEDRGRGAVTGDSDDDARFKTPTLRNVELHGPFMHNGRFATLEDVVDFYDRGGDFKAPNIDSIIRPLFLSPEEKADLVAFMKRPMTDPRVANELPPFDRPQLYTETNRVPLISGVGRPAIAGSVPEAIAIEPPLLGNQNFTLGVSMSAEYGRAVVIVDDTDPGILTSMPGFGSFLAASVNIVPRVNGDGYGSINISIPDDPSLVGRTFYGRWYVRDIRSRGRVAVSRLFSFTIFAPETATKSGPISR